MGNTISAFGLGWVFIFEFFVYYRIIDIFMLHAFLLRVWGLIKITN
jgi:hypothetical protein